MPLECGGNPFEKEREPRPRRRGKCDLNMTCAPMDHLEQYNAVVIVTDHSSYDYAQIVEQAQLVIDTRNATQGIDSPKIVRC